MPTSFAALSTLGVGGPIRTLVRAADREELIALAHEAFDDGRWLIVGGGSNILAGDELFDGTVVLVATEGIEAEVHGDHVRVRVQAGHNWDAFVAYAVSHGWAGIEALSGIPGTVGAAPIQNIGAYGQEVADTITRVEFLDATTGQVRWLAAAELGFDYRASVFKAVAGEPPERSGVVLCVEFELAVTGGQSKPIAFAQLAQALGVPEGSQVPLAEVRSQVLRLRAAKGMVLDAADADTRSAGSFFTNPIVSARLAAQLPSTAPRWPVDPDEPAIAIPLTELAAYAHVIAEPLPERDRRVKLSAAWLIEHSGIGKGFSIHGSRAAVSSKHTLALTNRGGATAEEIAQLARFIQSRVQAEFGVWLVPEPLCIGVEL